MHINNINKSRTVWSIYPFFVSVGRGNRRSKVSFYFSPEFPSSPHDHREQSGADFPVPREDLMTGGSGMSSLQTLGSCYDARLSEGNSCRQGLHRLMSLWPGLQNDAGVSGPCCGDCRLFICCFSTRPNTCAPSLTQSRSVKLSRDNTDIKNHDSYLVNHILQGIFTKPKANI